ncbi:unnamed protein product [Echinostoma caproni]|uniref:I/LWEQ domain-containing protein n=1 Tax=Echinostoma caproni TaxID=27848 RepID=A0A183B6H4_9TREM|nr:unnamed protein product [Echinostoma caproni]
MMYSISRVIEICKQKKSFIHYSYTFLFYLSNALHDRATSFDAGTGSSSWQTGWAVVSQIASAAAKRTSELAAQAGQKTKQLTSVVQDKAIRTIVVCICLESALDTDLRSNG